MRDALRPIQFTRDCGPGGKHLVQLECKFITESGYGGPNVIATQDDLRSALLVLKKEGVSSLCSAHQEPCQVCFHELTAEFYSARQKIAELCGDNVTHLDGMLLPELIARATLECNAEHERAVQAEARLKELKADVAADERSVADFSRETNEFERRAREAERERNELRTKVADQQTISLRWMDDAKARETELSELKLRLTETVNQWPKQLPSVSSARAAILDALCAATVQSAPTEEQIQVGGPHPNGCECWECAKPTHDERVAELRASLIKRGSRWHVNAAKALLLTVTSIDNDPLAHGNADPVVTYQYDHGQVYALSQPMFLNLFSPHLGATPGDAKRQSSDTQAVSEALERTLERGGHLEVLWKPWGIWCERSGELGFWAAQGLTETEAERRAKGLNESVKQRGTDSVAWVYTAKLHAPAECPPDLAATATSTKAKTSGFDAAEYDRVVAAPQRERLRALLPDAPPSGTLYGAAADEVERLRSAEGDWKRRWERCDEALSQYMVLVAKLQHDLKAQQMGEPFGILFLLETARKQANAGESADSEAHHRHFTCLAVENLAKALEMLAKKSVLDTTKDLEAKASGRKAE